MTVLHSGVERYTEYKFQKTGKPQALCRLEEGTQPLSITEVIQVEARPEHGFMRDRTSAKRSKTQCDVYKRAKKKLVVWKHEMMAGEAER